MSNSWYAKGAQGVLNAEIDFDSDTIKVALVKNTYPQSLSADEFYSDISAYVLGTPQALASKAITGGVFDAADATFTAVAAGDTAEAVVIYKDTGNPATSRLLLYIDTITGFPIATTGGNITVQWDNGADKIVKL